MIDHFFEKMFGSYDKPYLINVRCILSSWKEPKQEKRVVSNTFHEDPTSAKVHVMDVMENRAHNRSDNKIAFTNIFYGVLPRDYRSNKKEAVTQGSCVWVDIDKKEIGDDVLSNLDRIPVAPSIVVNTGNGIHAYWLLARPTKSVYRIVAVNRAFASMCGGDATHDVTRILRVPYTYNCKTPYPKWVKVVSGVGEKYLLEDLEELFIPYHSEGGESSYTPCRTSPFSLNSLPPLWQRYVLDGISADQQGRYGGDRSRLDQSVMNELVRRGATDEEIVEIFTNPQYGISEKALEKPKSYLSLTLNKSRQYVGGAHGC